MNERMSEEDAGEVSKMEENTLSDPYKGLSSFQIPLTSVRMGSTSH